jgi:hypothetical protein
MNRNKEANIRPVFKEGTALLKIYKAEGVAVDQKGYCSDSKNRHHGAKSRYWTRQHSIASLATEYTQRNFNRI